VIITRRISQRREEVWAVFLVIFPGERSEEELSRVVKNEEFVTTVRTVSHAKRREGGSDCE
jgi:hypothetical protein